MSLEEIRERIDSIDSEIIRLLNERAKAAIDVGKLKEQANTHIYAPAREIQIFEQICSRNTGPLTNEALKSIYKEIISASRSLEKPLIVSYLGPQATFAHLAALQKFGSSTSYLPARTISDVFIDVQKGRANYGVVPIENSTEGSVSYTLDMFMESDLKIFSEVMLEVSHNLMSKSQLTGITKIYSHPQALAQCRRWLEANVPAAELTATSSTAQAAELAAKDVSAGAIANEIAAEIYHLNLLVRRIEDSPYNYTRFLVVGHSIAEKSGRDKTSVMFSIRHRAGALSEILKTFASYEINLTRIESRPSRQRAWEYVFFVDLEGHTDDPRVAQALHEATEHCIFLKTLGSYPSGE
ncbi:MAG: prephenate dehydratase [Candidatus Abyssobacteria bacterium SURF_17]|uniref:Bifunctional chorismate mutase/prephenate dehydratase n=1 Tax=Candidatus Abyssobacteria bacterium SURF_17 TaxID=2093361 RepID=A0A419EZE9_9BACT|nr:MAG: prephenate dehydratase [Candidatus Abyssubacteria bacterium SURF_17]